LPVILIAELMGIDPGATRSSSLGRRRHQRAARAVRRRPIAPSSTRAWAAFKAFLGDIIEARPPRARDETDRSDRGACAGRRRRRPLSPAQALNFAVLLLLGGSETTTNLVGNALVGLLDPRSRAWPRARRPGARARSRRRGVAHDAPVQSVLRRTTGEVELAGAAHPAGATVLLLLGSANRDERVFARPGALPPRSRRDQAPRLRTRPALLPGRDAGAHGGRAALEALLALPDLRRRDGGEVQLVDSFVLRGPRALPLAFGAA
jgi:cytochrome P450